MRAMAAPLADRSKPSKAPVEPLGRALAPDIDFDMLERRGELGAPPADRAESLGDAGRGDIVGIDAVDEVVPAEHGDGKVHGGDGPFGRIALAPDAADEAPADLGARPALRPPGAEAADPAPALLLDD